MAVLAVAAPLVARISPAGHQTAAGGSGQRLAVGSRAPTTTSTGPARTGPSTTAAPTAAAEVAATPEAAASKAEPGAPAEGAAAGSGGRHRGDRSPAARSEPAPGPAEYDGYHDHAPAADSPVAGAAPPPPVVVPSLPQLARQPSVEEEVLYLTNQDRAVNGVAPLQRDGCLDAEASAWARWMAESATMAHSPHAGGAVQGCRGSSAYWGDNIGHWQPCLAGAMQTWWMNSPSHRPHVLDPTYRAVGVGVWQEPGGRCWFQVYFGS